MEREYKQTSNVNERYNDVFEEPATSYTRKTEKFYNPKIDKVEVTVESIPNQQYAYGKKNVCTVEWGG